MNAIVLSDKDLLSFMLSVKSPPAAMHVVMEESVMHDRVKLSTSVAEMRAVVSGDISVAPAMVTSDTSIVPPVPLRNCPDVTETAKLLSER